jgi:hypothetical protein
MLKVSSDVLNSHDQQLTLGDLFEIRKQNGLDQAEGPEPEPRDRTMMGLKLTEGLV